MIAIARFNVRLADASQFHRDLLSAQDAFSLCPGYLNGYIGQNLDETTLWSLTTVWENVGSYRRALSNNQVKMLAIPLLATAIVEPGAYERPDTE